MQRREQAVSIKSKLIEMIELSHLTPRAIAFKDKETTQLR